MNFFFHRSNSYETAINNMVPTNGNTDSTDNILSSSVPIAAVDTVNSIAESTYGNDKNFLKYLLLLLIINYYLFWYFLDPPPSYAEAISSASCYSGEVQSFVCFYLHGNFGEVLECEERGGYHTNKFRSRLIRHFNLVINSSNSSGNTIRRVGNTRRGKRRARWILINDYEIKIL